MSTFIANRDKAAKAKAVASIERPGAGVVGGEPAPVDYSKAIAEAQSKGNIGEAAYYMRLQQESTQTRRN